MSRESDLIDALAEIVERGDPAELEELVKELNRKRAGPVGSMKVDTENMAKSMAESIKSQMGISDKQIKKMSRDLVADLILQYKPDMPREHLLALVRHYVPDRKTPPMRIPADIMMEMVRQFVAYSKNEMTKKEKDSFPTGWTSRYWEIFPEPVQICIRDFLTGRIERDEFWRLAKDMIEKKFLLDL